MRVLFGHDYGLTPLELAIARGNIEVASVFLQYGALNLNAPKKNKLAAANQAASEEDEVYQGLDVGGKKMSWAFEHHSIDHSPDLVSTKQHLLHVAARHGQVKSIEYLLGNAVNDWRKSLSGKKIDPNTRHAPELKLDHVDTSGYTVYEHLILSDNSDIIGQVIQLDKEKIFDRQNNFGFAPIHLACYKKDDVALREFIKAGADVMSKDKARGWSPLHYAAKSNASECIKILTDVLTKEQISECISKVNNHTPLMIASYAKGTSAIEALLKSGKVDPFVKDSAGEYALHFAVRSGSLDNVKLLLDSYNEKYNDESGVGLTVLDCCMAMLLQNFPQDRVGADWLPSPIFLAIYEFVEKTQKHTRNLSSTDYISAVTALMMDKAKLEAKKEREQQAQNPRGRRFFRDRHSGYGYRDTVPDENSIEYEGLVNPFNVSFNNVTVEQFPVFPLTPEEEEQDKEEKEKKKELDDLSVESDVSDVEVDEEEVKKSKKSKKKESDNEDEAPSSLKNMVFAITGSLSLKRDDVVAAIKKAGGQYATSITKKVTHLITSDPDSTSAKISKARADGIKIVGESFIEKFL
eukprot:TRINITY_DN1568_c1_g2_i4.p1 TRINITY_DN1568_c1_g2~~TRINITY_DN1568_c1_g2_i4.p1  ORF type:complete len:578 (-),score=157.46 TRINITY_DN1568_c1_g2_i4:203-1936(-)